MEDTITISPTLFMKVIGKPSDHSCLVKFTNKSGDSATAEICPIQEHIGIVSCSANLLDAIHLLGLIKQNDQAISSEVNTWMVNEHRSSTKSKTSFLFTLK